MGLLDGFENVGATPEQEKARMREMMDLLESNPELAEKLRIRLTKAGGFTLGLTGQEAIGA